MLGPAGRLSFQIREIKEQGQSETVGAQIEFVSFEVSGEM
jgi:hypothetical protein